MCCILSKFYIKPQHADLSKVRHGCCILSKFYIKPQRLETRSKAQESCILSKFYIKPQHSQCHFVILGVVSYRNSTSNHNANAAGDMAYRLYLIEILHQTTTMRDRLYRTTELYLIEILHQTTTASSMCASAFLLYLIEILHQTTTIRRFSDLADRLYLIEILHQTTTVWIKTKTNNGCILSKFYIKPQQRPGR